MGSNIPSIMPLKGGHGMSGYEDDMVKKIPAQENVLGGAMSSNIHSEA